MAFTYKRGDRGLAELGGTFSPDRRGCRGRSFASAAFAGADGEEAPLTRGTRGRASAEALDMSFVGATEEGRVGDYLARIGDPHRHIVPED